MCGIFGKITFAGEHEPPTVFERAMELLNHRGPDDCGTYYGRTPNGCPVSLGHTRLSILDLSAAGHQPMISTRTGNVIVYNGEVYSFREIRSRLEGSGFAFHTECDTEAVLAAYDARQEDFVRDFIGMFAVAVWDRQRNKLILARDRLGIKPLYYYWDGRQFAFSSEITALAALPTLTLEVSQEAVRQLLFYGYIPYPLSIYTRIRKLPQAHILVLDLNEKTIRQQQYWDPLQFYNDPLPFASEDEVIEALDGELREAVRKRLISDVPIGAFLSGGIDSSLTVALMQQASTSPVKTFTIGFAAQGWDEAPMAKKIAAHLGTVHEELYITEENVLDITRTAADYYDEPFADSSSIPMLALSRMTRSHVTVALSGDGGDELFWGYNRYAPSAFAPFDRYQNIPLSLRQFLGAPLQHLKGTSFEVWGHLLGFKDFTEYYAGSSLLKLKLYPRLHPYNPEGNRLLEINRQVWSLLEGCDRNVVTGAMDLHSYLPDDILTKVDRASMSVALEARVPILDHNVVQLAARIPARFKTAGGELKHLLKRLLSQYVPEELWSRPKKGFGVPVTLWLRTSLKDWACDELLSTRYHLHDWLDKKELQKILNTHIEGKRNLKDLIWSCLQLACWDRRITDLRNQTLSAGAASGAPSLSTATGAASTKSMGNASKT